VTPQNDFVFKRESIKTLGDVYKASIMCGILAYLGIQPGSKYVLEGIKILRNRGYDSVGCCSIHANQVCATVTKYANTAEQDSFGRFEASYEAHHGGSRMLMAHCRWATCGKVSDENSHPHGDTLGQGLHLVHNGIITNHEAIREYLEREEPGIEFRSETDTETIVNLLAHYQKGTNPNPNPNPKSLMASIKRVLSELEGTWGLVIMDERTPDQLYVCRQGSPILVGYSDEMCIVSSEVSGFSNYLKNYMVIPDGEVLKITLDERRKLRIHHEHILPEDLQCEVLTDVKIHPLTPAPYPYWTLKEINDQPNSVRRALNFGGRLQSESEVHLGGLNQHEEELRMICHLVILASGTSYHAGLLGKKYMHELKCFETVQVLDAGEFVLDDIGTPVSKTGVLLISQSGETRDIVRSMTQVRKYYPGMVIFGAINVVGSLIAREVDCGVYLNCGREVGVAATKSYVSQCVVLMLISIWFSQHRGPQMQHQRQRMIEELHQGHLLIERTIQEMKTPIQKVSEHILKGKEHHGSIFILGHHKTYPIACEGALKIKEVSYIHAEAYSSAGLKHGPLALVEDGTPVIVIRPHDPVSSSAADVSAEETKARGGYMIAISGQRCNKEGLYDQEVLIPESSVLYPILSVIPLQYLAYLLSIGQGYNVDYPKNLAKCVTTD